jgi:hypothetical protein
MQLLSKASNIVQNIFCLYGVTSFTQLWHSIPVATKCMDRDLTTTQTIIYDLFSVAVLSIIYCFAMPKHIRHIVIE